eukprot:250075_1
MVKLVLAVFFVLSVGFGDALVDHKDCDIGGDPDAFCDTNKGAGYICLTTSDGKYCDFDECADSSHNCHEDATCTNILDGFECECNLGYAGNGTSCEPVCDP